jgi:hypothetical protein
MNTCPKRGAKIKKKSLVTLIVITRIQSTYYVPEVLEALSPCTTVVSSLHSMRWVSLLWPFSGLHPESEGLFQWVRCRAGIGKKSESSQDGQSPAPCVRLCCAFPMASGLGCRGLGMIPHQASSKFLFVSQGPGSSMTWSPVAFTSPTIPTNVWSTKQCQSQAPWIWWPLSSSLDWKLLAKEDTHLGIKRKSLLWNLKPRKWN